MSRLFAKVPPALLGLALVALAGGSPAAAQTLPVGADVQYQVLTTQTQDPLYIQVTSDGRVLWVEREGALKVLLPNGTLVVAGRVPVSANSCNDCVVQDPSPLQEGGLYSVLLTKDFDDSGRLYLFYSVPGSMDPATKFGKWRLSTFVLTDDNVLQLGTEKPIFEVPVEWAVCCHYGGNLEWMPDGTILLSTGDDIPASSSGGYGPRDPTPVTNNGELTSANPADRRGKILRLMPDGSLPDGSQPGIAANPFIGEQGYNPYIPDTSGTPDDGWIAFDPYIYSLGYKQPFRGSVHPTTGTAYFGDVGPDAAADDPTKGPRGQDELNVVPPGGGTHHGWPRCIANNVPYHNYDWETSTDNGLLDCSQMTGAVLYYPKDVSPQWPQVQAGGLTGIPAAVYPASTTGALRLPARFNNKLFDLEFSRDWIATIPIRADGTLDVATASVQMLTPYFRPLNTADPAQNTPVTLLGPIDATVGPDGALYFLEYGSGFYNNSVSRVSRLICTGCTANPADYGLPPGSRVDYGLGTAGDASTRAASTLPGSAAMPAAAWAAGGVLLLLAGIPRRRRIAA